MNNSTLTEMLEYSDQCEKISSLGFMELLNTQDFGPNSVFDVLQATVPSVNHSDKNWKKQVQESSEVLNAPATPNSSSISSESTDCQKDEQANKEMEGAEEEEENENQKTKKRLKTQKTSQKRQREPRFAFMTKTEVDHLEDGYRWRKYGQKAVKNSPFPRSYYKCTNASCNVKKRVERSCNDPTIVVTTYEGQHTHPNPQMLPRYTAALSPPYSGDITAPSQRPQGHMVLPHNQQQFINYSVLLNGYMGPTGGVNCGGGAQKMSFRSSHSSAPLLTDNGLLQDVLWSAVKKEDKWYEKC